MHNDMTSEHANKLDLKDEVIEGLFHNKNAYSLPIEPMISITKDVNFADWQWDFSALNKLHKGKNTYYRYNFADIKDVRYRIYLKKMVLKDLYIRRNSFSTTSRTFHAVKRFIKFLTEEKHIFLPTNILNRHVDEYLQQRNHIRVRTIICEKISIRRFLDEVELANEGIRIDFNPKQTAKEKITLAREIEIAKTSTIPRGYFNQIIQIALEDIKDENLDLKDRMVSCMILLFSQIGLRRGEAILLETNRLKEVSILNGEKKAYVMEFLTYKTTTATEGKLTETIMTDIACKAYKTLERIAQPRRINGSSILFPTTTGGYYGTDNFAQVISSFFLRNCKKLNVNALSKDEIKLLKKTKVVREGKFGAQRDEIGETFYRVTTHQFRVAVANEFKQMGVTLQWIREHMNHLSEEMTKHYFRDDTSLLKEALLLRASKDGTELELDSDKIEHSGIKDEVQDKLYIEAYQQINKYLKKKKLNIYQNLEEILDSFKDYPIRENELGYCTKALGKLCERQEKLTTMEKWYFSRPQVPNYIQFDRTYLRFSEKIKILEHNKKVAATDSRYKLQYILELKSLKRYLENKVLPECHLLKTELASTGIETLIIKYPYLTDVLRRFSYIYKECEEWKAKLMSEI
ncbi:tyrosine-type recombinase/integrase [Priestia megaterium]